MGKANSKRTIGAYLSEASIAQLDFFAKRRAISRSTAVSQIILDFLAAKYPNSKTPAA